MSLSRSELFARAKELGLETAPSMKNAELEELIAKAQEPQAEQPPAPETASETTKPEPPAAEEPAVQASAEETTSPETPSADAEAATAEPVEVDRDIVGDDTVVKSGFLKIRIKGFSGSYADAQFDDNGNCERISEGTMKMLITDFPGVDVVEYKEI